jgi:hypothetical protein
VKQQMSSNAMLAEAAPGMKPAGEHWLEPAVMAAEEALAELRAAGTLKQHGGGVPPEQAYAFWVGRLELTLAMLARAVREEIS